MPRTVLASSHKEFNMSHTVNKLSFGHDYPGSTNPLDGAMMLSDAPSLAYKYFLKVVPTLYVDLHEREISTNQFSVTEHATQTNFLSSADLPGVFFYYDLSPIKVMFKEHQTPTEIAAQFSGFVTIVGGTFILHSTKDMDLTGSLAGFNAKGQGPVANIRGTEELPILAGRETKQDL